MGRRRDKPVQFNLNTVIVAILLPLLVFTFFSFSATMQTYVPGTVIDVGRTISPIVDIGNERVVVFKPGTIWGPTARHLINGGGGVDSYAYQETTNYGAVSQTTEVSRTTVGNTQTTTVTKTTSDPQTGTTLQRETTSVSVNTATMTGTISTTRDHRGDVVDQVSYAVLQPILAPGATYMADRPEVKGNVRMTLRVVYSDGTHKDIEKQITIHYVASMLLERATGKHVKEFRVRAQGEITLVGLGTQSNADLLFILHAKPVVSSGQKIETKQVSNRVFLDSRTGWKAPVNLEITIPASDVAITPSIFYETSQGEYSILSSFELRATLRDYWEYPAKIRRELQLGGITEGPSCGGFYRLANPGIRNRYEIVGKYYEMDWIAEYSSGLLTGMDEMSFRWTPDGKLSVSGHCYVPGTYSFNLRAPKGRWSGTSFTMTRGAGRFSMTVDGPKPAPVTGKVNILFTSYLSTIPDKPLTTDTLRVSVLKYTYNRATNTYETSKVWEGELTSGVRQTLSVTLTHGESLGVRCTKNGWYQEQTRYGGTAEYSVYDAGDWFYFCENPEMDVNIKVIVPFRADVVQGIPEFRVETTTKTNTISVNSPDTSVEVKTSLPFAAMGQVPEGTPGARKLVVEAQPGELNFPPGTYWFKDGSHVHVRVVAGVDYVTVDGERRVTGGYQSFTVVMNADRYIKVYAGAATRTVKYGIEGTVMDGERRTPIPGATIRVYEYGKEWDKPLLTLTTDSKGYFRFEVENRYASYTIVVTANGYKEFKTSTSAPNIIAIFLFPPSSNTKEYPENYYASANPNDVHNVVVEVKGNDVVRTYYGTESFVTGGERGVENTMLPFIGKPTGVKIETENKEIMVGKESFRLEGGSYEFQATPERITSGVMTSEALDISAYGLLVISLVIGTALAIFVIRGLGKGGEERARHVASWRKRR